MVEPLRTLRIGTRGSPLALAQTTAVRDALARSHGWPQDALEIVAIKTSGDAIVDRPLELAGGKGLFSKEIDAAMLDGRIDLAVHSAKDLPTWLPQGIVIAGYTAREDVRDALIAPTAVRFADLPRGARVGTASLRRAAQVKRLRPDIETSLLRGNVETRLRKAESGEIDATLLAVAGLKRLGLLHRATAILETDAFLPAVGQGAVAITARTDDAFALAALAPILCAATGTALLAERAFLAVLDGSCRTPIAGHARVRDGRIAFTGLVLREDGSETRDARADGAAQDAERIGAQAGHDIPEPPAVGFLSGLMRVLLTRATDDAQSTAARLSEAGHTALVSPLITIAPTGALVPKGRFDAVLATSLHALSSLAVVPPALVAVPWFVVGTRLAVALRAQPQAEAARDATVVAPDVARLLAAIVARHNVPGIFLYLAGRPRKPDLERGLRAHGHEIVTMETYAAAPAAGLSASAVTALHGGAIDAALHFSARSAQLFCDAATDAGLNQVAATLHHVAISPDAALPLQARGWRVAAAARPDEAAMIAALGQITSA